MLVNGGDLSMQPLITDRSWLLTTLLLARQGAAAAAWLPDAGNLGQELSPSWQCEQAERLVRQELAAEAAIAAAADADLVVQLIDVFEAATRPMFAVRLGVEVASGHMQVGCSLSGADGNSVIAAAMSVSNQAGLPLGTVLMLEELLAARGKVEDVGVMAQVRSGRA